MRKKKIVNLIHAGTAIIFGLFFIYKGFIKLISDKLKPVELNKIINTIIDNGVYEPPVAYNIVMNTFKYSGFLDMISLIQILAGFLIIIPLTRLIGVLVLLPIIFNIFFMHVFFDNRIGENIETGILLVINIFLCFYYQKHILNLLIKTRSINTN